MLILIAAWELCKVGARVSAGERIRPVPDDGRYLVLPTTENAGHTGRDFMPVLEVQRADTHTSIIITQKPHTGSLSPDQMSGGIRNPGSMITKTEYIFPPSEAEIAINLVQGKNPDPNAFRHVAQIVEMEDPVFDSVLLPFTEDIVKAVGDKANEVIRLFSPNDVTQPPDKPARPDPKVGTFKPEQYKPINYEDYKQMRIASRSIDLDGEAADTIVLSKMMKEVNLEEMLASDWARYKEKAHDEFMATQALRRKEHNARRRTERKIIDEQHKVQLTRWNEQVEEMLKARTRLTDAATAKTDEYRALVVEAMNGSSKEGG